MMTLGFYRRKKLMKKLNIDYGEDLSLMFITVLGQNHDEIRGQFKGKLLLKINSSRLKVNSARPSNNTN